MPARSAPAGATTASNRPSARSTTRASRSRARSARTGSGSTTKTSQPASSSVRAQLDAVAGDIGIDAAKTGMLFSRPVIEAVADWLEEHPVPLVVDPVMLASSGARLLEDDALEVLVARLFPLATVVTPNLLEARALVESDGPPDDLAETRVRP